MGVVAITGENGSLGLLISKLAALEGMDFVPLERSSKGVERLWHLAAKSPPASFDEIINSNVNYLQTTVKKAVATGIHDLVFFSAISVYGSSDHGCLNEDALPQHPNFFGISKLLGEEYLRQSELRTLSVRLPGVLQYDNMLSVISRLHVKLSRDEVVEIYNADRLFNNFLAVQNLFEFLKDLEFKKHFDVVNLASRLEWNLEQIVSYLKDRMNSKSKIIIRDDPKPYFNISTNKAETLYGFQPWGVKKSLDMWLEGGLLPI